MLADKLDAFLNRIKQVLLGVVGAIVLVVLTILLLAPNMVSDFVVEIPSLMRWLLVVVVYTAIGTFSYTRLQNVQKGRQIKGLVVKSSGGALAELSVESARDQILKTVLKLPSVISSDATVSTKRGKAVIRLNVVMKSDDVSLPDKQKEIARVLGDVVEKQLGLRMAERPTVQINLDGGGAPVAVSPKRESAQKLTEEASSPVERLGRRIFGEKSGDQPSQHPLEPAEGEGDEDSDDETSGEFWEFLKSTASSPAADDGAIESSLQSDDEAVDDAKEPITGLLDMDAPVIGNSDSVAQEEVEEDDELADSSS